MHRLSPKLLRIALVAAIIGLGVAGLSTMPERVSDAPSTTALVIDVTLPEGMPLEAGSPITREALN